MLRNFIYEILLPLIIFGFLRSFLKDLFATKTEVPKAGPPPPPSTPPTVTAGGELKKDPVCGTYVSTAVSVTRTVNGQVLYFCSQECRDKYRAA